MKIRDLNHKEKKVEDRSGVVVVSASAVAKW
jgi:hypothetical protein